MALLNVNCPSCNAEHEVDESMLGASAECSSCGEEFELSADSGSSDGPQLSIDYAKELWGKSIDSGFGVEMSIKPDSTIKSSTYIPDIQLRPFIISHDADKPEDGSSYTIITKLGQGGMGAVYRAHQHSTDRKVALKVILPDKRLDEDKQMSFLTEAVVTANLDHPNIMPVYDVGYDQDNNPFYSMKEITGKSWQHLINDKTEKENLQILLDVCDAMAYAHDQGVIHRDLKPENVMIGEYGEVVVVDWGLAAGFGDAKTHKAEPLTEQSSYGGTAAYMSPEMAACSTDEIGPASDIYLLGGILYRIVTGLVPHNAGDVFATIHDAMANVIQPTDKKGELVDIALEAMATNPEERFSSVKGFKNAISAYLTHSESITLQKSAEHNLIEAEATGNYKLYAQSQFGFAEAVKQWPDNKEAKKGLNKATLAYATRALKKDDLELVQSLLDDNRSEYEDLLKQANKKQSARIKRQRNMRILTLSSLGLMAGIIVVMVFAYLWVKNEEQKAVKSKNDAIKAKSEAWDAEQKARTEELRAKDLLAKVEDERDKTKKALLQLEEEKKKVEEEKRKALSAKNDANITKEKMTTAEKMVNDLVIIAPELAKYNGPVKGSDWRIPGLGMEFVWIESLNCWVGKYEVTIGEYSKFKPEKALKETISRVERFPAVVDFKGAQKYAKWLHNREWTAWRLLPGYIYRLPTKDEWTTFCQCGDNREYPWGNTWPPKSGEAGNYRGIPTIYPTKLYGYEDGFKKTCPVEKSWKNKWGLYGVGGNVWELTIKSDEDPSFSALRGGSFRMGSKRELRSKGLSESFGGDNKAYMKSLSYSEDIGLRLILSRSQKETKTENLQSIKTLKSVNDKSADDLLKQYQSQLERAGISARDIKYTNGGVSLMFLNTIEPFRNLKDIPIYELDLTNCYPKDLTPLKGLPLKKIMLNGQYQISDLSPLKGMNLEELDLGLTSVNDLSPLKGMPLKRLNLLGTPFKNLSSLKNEPERTILDSKKRLLSKPNNIRILKELISSGALIEINGEKASKFIENY